MGGWQDVTIGDACQVVNGGTPKTKVSEYWDGPHAWITPAEMGRRESPYINDTGRTLSEEGLSKCSASLLPPCSVILSSRAPIGHLVINEVPMATNQGCKGLVPGSELHHKFLYYYLHSVVDLLNDLGTGTTFKELSATKLKGVPISLPPLPEQERIVAILDEAVAAIAAATANAETNLANARELFENYVNRVFAQKQNGWRETALGNVAAFKNGLNFTKNSTGEIVKIVGVRNFQSNHWVPMDELDAVQIEGALSEPYTLRKHDILTVRSNGNRQLIGRCILVGDVPEKVSYSGFTIRIRVHSSDLDPTYLIHYLRSGVVREKLVKSGGGTNISNLNQKGLSVLAVRMPDRDEQSEIVMRVEAVKAEIERLALSYQAKASSLTELKQSILHKAFTGELTADFDATNVALAKGEV